jgi:hypothetical protein
MTRESVAEALFEAQFPQYGITRLDELNDYWKEKVFLQADLVIERLNLQVSNAT